MLLPCIHTNLPNSSINILFTLHLRSYGKWHLLSVLSLSAHLILSMFQSESHESQINSVFVSQNRVYLIFLVLYVQLIP